jgi:hypothetical protein
LDIQRGFSMRKGVCGILILSGLISLSGCASIIRGSNDTISVNSLEQDAVIYVDGAPRGKGSIAVDVRRGKPHDLVVKKEGCQDIAIKTTDRFDSVTLLGILIDWGIVSIPVDLISGSAWKQDPATYTITPLCPTQTKTPTPTTTSM